jgi:hypothetical protein
MSEATLLESVTADPKWAATQIVELHQRVEELEAELAAEKNKWRVPKWAQDLRKALGKEGLGS